MTSREPRALVVTIGPHHDKPWWWDQLASSPWRPLIGYERISIEDRPPSQLGLKQAPTLVRRVCSLLRAARSNCRGPTYIFTFEADVTCYLIGLLQNLRLFAGPRHVILQFISREKERSIKSRLKDAVAVACLRTVHCLIVSSRNEADYYRRRFDWPAGKVKFAPFHTDERLLAHAKRPMQNVIVAAGRSYRDYATLARAVAGTGIRTIIVCGRRGPGVSELPDEIEVISEIPLPALLDLMSSARAIVLPLENRRISTGQTVLLQAMALGRPVIATRTAGTEDYIRHDIDGVLVRPQDPTDLREAIRRVWDRTEFAEALAAQARAAVMSRHLPVHYAAAVAAALGCAEPAIT